MPRDRVGAGREPDSRDRHVRAFGADRDFAGALPQARADPAMAIIIRAIITVIAEVMACAITRLLPGRDHRSRSDRCSRISAHQTCSAAGGSAAPRTWPR